MKSKIFTQACIAFMSIVVTVIIIEEFFLMNYTAKTNMDTWFNNPYARQRVWGCWRFDPYIIYHPIDTLPDIDQCQFDENGFRKLNIPVPSKGKIILFMGDSETYGHGVNNEEAYPAQAQQMLNDMNIPVISINAGIPGTGTDQQLVFLRKYVLLKVKPDIVVWNITENDILWFSNGDNNQACLFSVVGNQLFRFPGWLNTLFIKGNLALHAPEFIKQTHIYQFIMDALPDRWTLGCSKTDKTPDTYHFKKMNLLIKQMEEDAKTYNFKLFTTFIDLQQEYADVESNSTHDYHENAINNYIHAIGEAGVSPLNIRQSVISMIDSQRASPSSSEIDTFHFREGSPSAFLFLNNDYDFVFGQRHMNKYGNYYFAKVVVNELLKLLK